MRNKNKAIRLKFAGPLLSGLQNSSQKQALAKKQGPSRAIKTALGLNYNSPVEVLCSELLRAETAF